jgi:4-hydroxybenzoate polyprenyltransferase
LKNTLVFVPLAASHQVAAPELLVRAVLAFISFSLCASSVYVVNDLMDLPSDRHHPRKRHRPFAKGELAIVKGLTLAPLLLAGALCVAWLLGAGFLGVLAGYFAVTLAYSWRLKRIMLMDVMVLAGLYSLRIIAGSVAVSVVPSFWLLAYSMFIFLSLAMIKRYSELTELHQSGQKRSRGRGYEVVDRQTLMALGGASGYSAVLVLALYINSDAVREMYTRPEVIWFLCPLLLYWISRMWLISRRGKMHDDPIVFALRDHVSRWVAALVIAILLLAV